MHNGLFRAHFRLPARIRYCNEWEKELDLGSPVCGLALINLIRKVNGGGLVRDGGRRVKKYSDGFCHTGHCNTNLNSQRFNKLSIPSNPVMAIKVMSR